MSVNVTPPSCTCTCGSFTSGTKCSVTRCTTPETARLPALRCSEKSIRARVFEALGCMPAITLALTAGTDKAARASLPERAARSARKNGRATLPSRHVARDARTVIHEIDESLRRLVLRDAVNGSGVELSFEAPTKEWASRRNTPTINIYLYDIREDAAPRGRAPGALVPARGVPSVRPSTPGRPERDARGATVRGPHHGRAAAAARP